MASQALVLSIDGLSAGGLGPFGNAWIDTPHCNRLAAESFLFDRATTDSPRLDLAYRSFWTASHAACAAPPSNWSLPAEIVRSGEQAVLLTDEPECAEHELARHFSEIVRLPAHHPLELADDLSETELARTMGAAIDWLQNHPPGGLVWIHLGALRRAWDAPYELREQFADEDDPPPPESAQPPSYRVSSAAGSDQLLGIQQAYAAQILVFDLCLGALLEAVSSRIDDMLFALTAPRGYPLGEHEFVGLGEMHLYEELIHTPLMIRLPHAEFASQRSAALVQPADLSATLADWLGVSPPTAAHGVRLLPCLRGDTENTPDRAITVGDRQATLDVASWRLRRCFSTPLGPNVQTPAGASNEPEFGLYVKPDDRWEENEIGSLCGEIGIGLSNALDASLESLAAGGPIAPEPISPEFTRQID